MLDTLAYSAFMKGHADVKLALQKADEIVLNPVILGELKAGFRRATDFGKTRTSFRFSFRRHALGLST